MHSKASMVRDGALRLGNAGMVGSCLCGLPGPLDRRTLGSVQAERLLHGEEPQIGRSSLQCQPDMVPLACLPHTTCLPLPNKQKLFSGLGMGQTCTVQLEFKHPGGGPVETVSVRAGRRPDEPETMPLYSNKDTVAGEVRARYWLGLGQDQVTCNAIVEGKDWAGVIVGACHGKPQARRLRCPSSAKCISSAHPLLVQVKVTPIPGKRVDHQGIRVQLVGEVELASERGHPHEFLSLGAQMRG